jgi:hypothetical protein
MKKICIVHYNTPYALTCLIKSINKHVNDCYIYVFENSDINIFENVFDNVEVFDNSKGQILDYDKLLKKYPDRFKTESSINGWASFKHCLAIDKCFDLINDNFVLLDSDVLIKKDFSELYQDDKVAIGEYETTHKRLAPYICFINVNFCKEHNIRYFNENYMLGIKYYKNKQIYDTGSFFFNEIKNFSYDTINTNDYITHYKSGSFTLLNNRITLNEWVNQHNRLWHDEKIILTMTTWPKRIKNIPHTLSSILEGNMLPDKICINLSLEEFPNKEEDFPIEVQNFINEHKNIIELHWLVNNTKTWKKIIPTLYRYPFDYTISCDDDFIYPKDFVESFIKKHKEYPNKPISGVDNEYFGNSIQHCGPASLDNLYFFKNTLEDITKEIYNAGSTDTFFTYCYYTAKNKMIYVGKRFNNNMEVLDPDNGYTKGNKISHSNAWLVCKRSKKDKEEGRQIIEYICQTEDMTPIFISDLGINVRIHRNKNANKNDALLKAIYANI